MICKQCNTEFEGRADAKYCSAKCRVVANRNTNKAKCNKFEDLPIDVQHSIDRLSDSPEEFIQRAAIAIDYANKHSGSRHTGIDPDMVVNKPEGYKPVAELLPDEYNRVTKPSDPGYGGHGVVEHCINCRDVLSPLEQPRQYPGMCLACSTDNGGVHKDGMIRQTPKARPKLNYNPMIHDVMC